MRVRILIADDNQLVRRAMRHALETVDHWEVLEARDGYEALSICRESRPDVVVLDLAMPVMDGLSAARAIAKALPDVPLLMCTMHASPQLEIEARQAGVRQIIPKSDSFSVVSSIRNLLAGEGELEK